MDCNDVERKLSNLSICEESGRNPLQCISSDSRRVAGHAKANHEVSAEEKDCFNNCVKQAKQLAHNGKVQEALVLYKQAVSIYHHEKLVKRIAKIEEYLKNYGGDGDNDDDNEQLVQVGGKSGFYLHKDLYGKLYSHQGDGVLWFWGLHKRMKGGILGDDMGLGKTIQVIAFLSGMFDMDKIRNALIVMPVTVVMNWEKEFSKWSPGISVSSYFGNSKRERDRCLQRVQRRGGVILTTYGLVLTSWMQFGSYNEQEFVWDYVILDEGHKIKNPSKTTKAVHGIPARHRFIVTGTPIQNNLKELWSLFDYIHQGRLLGTLRTFKMEFETPIIRARERDATHGEKSLGLEMAATLKRIIDPYFLRRTKTGVKDMEEGEEVTGTMMLTRMPKLTFKNDFVLWLYLSDTQMQIYKDFLALDGIKELLASSRSPLVALTVLKKICDHPRLLSLRACHQLGLHGEALSEEELEIGSYQTSAVTKINTIDDDILIGEAGKMGVVFSLVDHLCEQGHRILLFSQSRKVLDIVQKVFNNQGVKMMRLDGTVGMRDREQLVMKFQNDKSYSVFLLTTQVGGVGLTLTAADRVIIYDPSWNPATDAQAVDRVFRIGQTRDIVVYRLITCGTVEEKIYRRQIFKDSITRQATGASIDPFRYFTKGELRELFQLEDFHFSNTQCQLQELHGLDYRTHPKMDDHIAFLHSLAIFGISRHDMMFSQQVSDSNHQQPDDTAHDIASGDQQCLNYIHHRAQKAQEIIERESSDPLSMEQRLRAPISLHPQQNIQAATKSNPSAPHWKQAHPMAAPASHRLEIVRPNPADNIRFMPSRLLPSSKDMQPSARAASDAISCETLMSTLNMHVNNTHGSPESDPTELSCGDTDGNITPPDKHTAMTIKEVDRLQVTTCIPGKEPVTERLQDKEVYEGSPSPARPDMLLEEQPPPAAVADSIPNTFLQQQAAPQSNGSVVTKPPVMYSTPKFSGAAAVLEEELIISPNAYTPLMMTRQKRRKLSGSLITGSENSISASIFVANTPDTSPTQHLEGNDDVPAAISHRSNKGVEETPEASSSFTGEDSRSCVSSCEEGTVSVASQCVGRETRHSALSACADQAGLGGLSDDDETAVGRLPKVTRRRSVCRRVAVVESSEDECIDDEDKENIDPSFSGSGLAQAASGSDIDDSYSAIDNTYLTSSDRDSSDDGAVGNVVRGWQDNNAEPDDDVSEDGDNEKENIPVMEARVEICDESADGDGCHSENSEQFESSGEDDYDGDDSEELDVELLRQYIMEGRSLYKQKRYPEALEKTKVALSMYHDAALVETVEKIKRKIAEASGVKSLDSH